MDILFPLDSKVSCIFQSNNSDIFGSIAEGIVLGYKDYTNEVLYIVSVDKSMSPDVVGCFEVITPSKRKLTGIPDDVKLHQVHDLKLMRNKFTRESMISGGYTLSQRFVKQL